ncbi:hypothetical protein M3Y95_00319800 [Aphelenchoides besseyi]|nr:hypothetical protein M3Y95_00319800 [Aphelenchoides besseyi]
MPHCLVCTTVCADVLDEAFAEQKIDARLPWSPIRGSSIPVVDRMGDFISYKEHNTTGDLGAGSRANACCKSLPVVYLLFALLSIIPLFYFTNSLIATSQGEWTGLLTQPTTENHARILLRNPEEYYQIPRDNVTLSDELNADIYSLDYSLSHPFENKYEPDLLPTVEHYLEADCPKPKTPVLVEQLHTGEILVGRRFLSNVTNNFTCYAQEISGALRPKNKEFEYIGSFIKLPYNKRIYVEKDQFHVQCKDGNETIIFEDVFNNLPYKTRLNPPQLDGTHNFSVSLLVLDSTARNQFFRHAPQTLKFMKEQGFQILHGYNKVADNSAVNLLPLLSGKTFDVKLHGTEHLTRPDMHLTPEMIEDDVWKHVNMIPKLMKERGCATLWNDDVTYTLNILNICLDYAFNIRIL